MNINFWENLGNLARLSIPIIIIVIKVAIDFVFIAGEILALTAAILYFFL